MKLAVDLPTVGELADPRAELDLAVAAEACGWDGFFLWDHLLRPPSEPPEVADTFVALAGVACATSRIRLGPMVSPIARYGPQRLARACVTPGPALGGPAYPWPRSGPRPLGRAALRSASRPIPWSGPSCSTRASPFSRPCGPARRSITGPRATGPKACGSPPCPYSAPGIPLWFAARGDARRPVRRAARYEGLFPVDVNPRQFAAMLDTVAAERGSLEGFDVAVSVPPGGDPGPYAARGATWVMWAFQPCDSVATVLARIEGGPAG